MRFDDLAANFIAAGQALLNYRPTFAEAVAVFAVDTSFACDADGPLCIYRRTNREPFYQLMHEVPSQSSVESKVSAAVLASPKPGEGSELVGYDGGTVKAGLDALYLVRPFEKFLASDYDPNTDDCSADIEEAAAWSSTNKGTVVFSRRYRIANCAMIDEDDVSFRFDGAQFDVLDTGTAGTISNTASGPIGILFKTADRLKLSGTARFIGHGTIEETRLAGIVFDLCDQVIDTTTLYLELMAAGVMHFWCDYSVFGNIIAKDMNGLQTFGGAARGGSARVSIGCKNSRFGNINVVDCYKPVLYLSTATDASEAIVTNTDCVFGDATGTAAAGSTESALLQLRGGLRCKIGNLSGTGFANGAVISTYDTDAGLENDGNMIASIAGDFPSTGASADAAIRQERQSGSAPAIGTNYAGTIHAECGGEFGILVAHGTLEIGTALINGGARCVELHSGTLIADTLVLSGYASNAVLLGRSGNLKVDLIDIQSGSTAISQAGVLYHHSFGHSGGLGAIDVGTVRYRHNSMGNHLNIVVWDNTNAPTAWRIGHIDGTGALEQARFGGSAGVCNIRHGKVYRDSMPTLGGYTRGDMVWVTEPGISRGHILLGWSRLTTGSSHVSGTDWAPIYASVALE